MKNSFRIENIYLILALLFGTLFIFLIPPFQSPDEDSHFKKAYMVSKGHFYGVESNKKIGNYIPNNMQDYINDKLTFMGNRDMKYSYSLYALDTQTLTVSSDKSFNNYSTVGINPIIYLIPALGIIIAKIFSVFLGLSFTISNLLYCGRLLSLISYSLIVFYAIKISPKFKKSMMALALMPMTLTLFSTITYDSLIISCSFLLFGITMKYVHDDKLQKISQQDLVILSIIFFVFISLKYIYVFNFLILLIIPKSKFNFSKKENLKRYIGCICGVIFIYLLTNLPNYMLNTPVDANAAKLTLLQRNFVLSHPFKYLGIFFNEIFNHRFFYLSSFVGTLGLLDTFLPIYIIVLYILFLIVNLIIDGSNYNKKVSIFKRILGIIIPIFIIALSFLGMYLIWTPLILGVKATSITGVQGRYFIPALCLLPIAFSNNFKLNKYDKLFDYITPIFISIVLINTCAVLVLRFWI